MPRRTPQMSGILDWFRKFVPPSPGAMIPFVPPKGESQLPAVRPSTLPAVPKKEPKQLSFFDFPPIFDFLRPEKERQERGLILPQIPMPTAMFEFMAPAPPAPTREEEKRLEQEVWGQMFKPSEEPLPSSEEMLKFLKPETIQEARYPHPDTWSFGEPPIWSDTRWEMPTTYELRDLIHQKWDLPLLWENILRETESAWWKRDVEESAHSNQPATMVIDQLTNSAIPAYGDIGNFLNIPDYVIERYGLYGHEGLERLFHEVFKPMLERVGKALDVLRPTRELRGWFELERDRNMNFYLLYKEAKFMPQEK